ncbi:MAG: hypothetical protein HC830_00250 [Bacteroidetes bacterium]|nr:hypothetical protein [Bacteroidota bacterium]
MNSIFKIWLSAFLFCCLSGSTSYVEYEKGRSYFNDDFSPDQTDSIAKVRIKFNDTIPNDTLYICLSKSRPVAVYRDVLTDVCLDGQCRRISLKLYWTITGRYLGYALEKNQELTKKEHTTFSAPDYVLLHNLLGDSLSVLAYFTAGEIQPKQTKNIKTDGISGATPPDISGYTVPEAAYTTHTLWHLVYGESRDSISYHINNFINVALLDSLLKNLFHTTSNGPWVKSQPVQFLSGYFLKLFWNCFRKEIQKPLKVALNLH